MVRKGRVVRTKGGTKFKRSQRQYPKGAHDWGKFPEVSEQSDLFHSSPHLQIIEDIEVRVVRVKDGDTIEVKWERRNFLFAVRLAGLFAPENNTFEGRRVRQWLKNRIQNKKVLLKINRGNRIGKWGRLLAVIMLGGADINQELLDKGFAITPEEQSTGKKINLIHATRSIF